MRALDLEQERHPWNVVTGTTGHWNVLVVPVVVVVLIVLIDVVCGSIHVSCTISNRMAILVESTLTSDRTDRIRVRRHAPSCQTRQTAQTANAPKTEHSAKQPPRLGSAVTRLTVTVSATSDGECVATPANSPA
jgi:hypothetical protein